MHDYYFKIKRKDIEFEFSTNDKQAYEDELYNWVRGFTPGNTPEKVTHPEIEAKRSGFIDNIRNMVSINEIRTPDAKTAAESFDALLEETIAQPKTEVVEKAQNISGFADYVQSFNPADDMDYLMITGKYIMDIENKERFSIKQLNAKLVPLTGVPLDHAIINQAKEEDLIQIVPDLTGIGEVTEYSLTEKGEGYFVQ